MPAIIGNNTNQVPTNGDLGTLAFQDSNAVNITGGTIASDRVIVGGSDITGGVASGGVQSLGTDAVRFLLARYTNNSTGPNLYFYKSRGTSVGTNVAPENNDNLGALIWSGFNTGTGSIFNTSVQIQASMDGTPSANNMPGRLAFFTTANGAFTTTERMRISSTGEVLVGGTTSVDDRQGVITVESVTGAALNLIRDDTTTAGTNNIGRVRFWGNDTTSNIRTEFAYITAISSGAHAAGDNPTDLIFGTTPDGTDVVTEAVRIKDGGGLQISRTAVTAPAAGDGNVFSGTYTPTLTNVTNVAASTAVICQYMRVGNVVTVSGTVNIDPTAASTLTVVRISLPIASAMTATTQLAGTCHGNWVVGVAGAGAMIADTTNDEALLRTIPPNDANAGYAFTFTYRIV
jgi:hypothetical protein